MTGTCFRCHFIHADRPIHDGSPTPVGYVCRACDEAAVEQHRAHALEYVERAQREMGTASEKLSSICFGDPARKRLRGLYDRIHREWYHLKDRDRSKWSMDDNYWIYRFREAQKS